MKQRYQVIVKFSKMLEEGFRYRLEDIYFNDTIDIMAERTWNTLRHPLWTELVNQVRISLKAL